MVRYLGIVFLLPLLILTFSPAWGTDDSTLWNDALTKIDSGDLAQAAAALNQLLTEFPNSPKAPGAQLKLAYLKVKTTPTSTQDLLNAFSLVRTKYGSSPEAGEALARIGYLHSKNKQTTQAIEEFSTFVRDHPAHPLAAEAQRTLGNLYLRNLDLDKAEAAFDAVGSIPGAEPALVEKASMQSGFVKIMRYYATKDKAHLTNAITALSALDSAANADVRAQAKLGICEATLLLHNPWEAHDKYKAAVPLCSSPYLHGIAMYGVAISSQETGEMLQAVSEYDAFLESLKGKTLAEKDQGWRQTALSIQSTSFKALAEHDRDWTLVPGADLVYQSVFNKGRCLYLVRHYDDAIAALNQLLPCLASQNSLWDETVKMIERCKNAKEVRKP